MAQILLATLLAAGAALTVAVSAGDCHPGPVGLGCPHPPCPPLCLTAVSTTA